ncbi:MAG: hypothetical protein ACOY0T_31260 [Myxococcota bacterium]
MKKHLSYWLCCVLGLVACEHREHAAASAGADAGAAGESSTGAQAGAGGDGGASGADALGSTAPRSNDAGCIISADCVQGTHCDLGECVQDCNEQIPCAKGLVCSPRGRCLPSATADADPPPAASLSGVITAAPAAFELQESDSTFEVNLSSTAKGLVEYRVDLRAPFLSLVGSERGSFQDHTKLTFKVNPQGLTGTVTPGTILVHTNLGDALVSPSIRVGLSGQYQGVMRYSTGGTAFGDVGIAAVIRDDHGDVVMGLDPKYSMTFPRIAGKVAAGKGSFTFSDGLNVTVTQSIAADFGGNRNRFQRPLGRQITFALKPSSDASAGGRLEGTFREIVYGILAQPIALDGSVYLEPREAAESVAFEVPGNSMPVVGGKAFAPIDVFAGWAHGDEGFGSCFVQSGATWTRYVGPSVGGLRGIQELEDRYYMPLAAALAGPRSIDDSVHALAQACSAELARTGLTDLSANADCAYTPPLACALRAIADTPWNTKTELMPAYAAYNRVFARTLAPALFVAQHHIVEGVKLSFQKGTQAQSDLFKSARAVLNAPLTFVLSSGALQYLKDLPVAIAAGDPASKDSTVTNYPAGRALARALYVQHTIDGEQARLDASDLTKTQDAKLNAAQERGVLGLLEAIALSAVLESWGAPPNLGNEFVGSLTLADRGFQALQQGGVTFGVPDGDVPIASGAATGVSNNFELLLQLAKPALELQAADETAFTINKREFEQNAAGLRTELENVQNRFDSEILEICGPSFHIADIKTDDDWVRCGADGAGQFAELGIEIQLAQGRLQSAQAHLCGMQQKLAIYEKQLADTQRVRADAIAFTDSAGEQKIASIVAEGIVNIAQKTIEIASHANIMNGGAPLGEALAMGMLEAQRTAIQASRQELENAQALRALADEKQVELLAGEAEIQKQLIDIAGASLDIQQEGLGVTLSKLRERDLLEKAKRTFESRTRSMSRIAESPLTDPIFRVLASSSALKAIDSRANAQTWLYRAGRALEYEMNRPLGDALGRAVLGAYNEAGMNALTNCMRTIYNDYFLAFGQPQDYVTTFSVRRMLGVIGPRTDEVTGAQLSEGELFRRAVLRNENFDSSGDLTFSFSTNLQPGNQLWATNLCNDKVAAIQAQLVGDFQGDNQAQVVVALNGGALLRECDSSRIINWSLSGDLIAAIDAGVNSFGETNPNSFLFGQSVARATWKLTIPSGSIVPQNSDLHLDRLEDVVIRVKHKALPRKSKATAINTSCLGSLTGE